MWWIGFSFFSLLGPTRVQPSRAGTEGAGHCRRDRRRWAGCLAPGAAAPLAPPLTVNVPSRYVRRADEEVGRRSLGPEAVPGRGRRVGLGRGPSSRSFRYGGRPFTGGFPWYNWNVTCVDGCAGHSVGPVRTVGGAVPTDGSGWGVGEGRGTGLRIGQVGFGSGPFPYTLKRIRLYRWT